MNREDFELLLMAMGHHLAQREIDACMSDMGAGNGDNITFDLFFEWWTDSMGMEAIRKKYSRK